ncbi:tRNA 2-selenouridine(34) synthase MnmH [Oceaniglobus indicus]|uniref:tRNA 2-selenouridine(34) synthase MnmH n=1 Tax=Oceaniglobus indicus TaxID=2047749 RepID=UPI000C1993D4|nr:tRNA 2-selenouridine(34) synthase MnmH [Oceaniglobus indicus]
MAIAFDTFTAFRDHGFDTLIDVRAPSEYAEDHVPGAISLPVLSDAERARVGTIYKQVSAFDARKIGAALVARNAATHIEGALAGHDGGWRPLVYCWRGGQRSNAFASILTQIGWRAGVVEGGYRSYRRAVKAMLYDQPFPCPVVLLDGNTGTAKTELLHLARDRGVQILDLEGLANHRGSLFGAMGDQPAQKGFESRLADAVAALTPGRPVLVEAESSKVGQRVVPPSLWSAMGRARRIELRVPPEARASYLTRTYADIVADTPRLMQTLSALVRLQGHDRVARWKDLAMAGAHETLALELMRDHYDPRYGRERGAPDRLAVIEAATLDADGLARAADRIAALMHGLAAQAVPDR